MLRFRFFMVGMLLALFGTLALAGSDTGSALSVKQKDFVVPPYKTMQVSMDILVNGKVVTPIHWQGKTYLPVKHWDTPYQIRVWNHGPKRITSIVSVDGLSVISGEPAWEGGAGYIVSPNSSIIIKGWRQDNEMVAAFTFVPRSQSHASKVGRPENVGVIGLVAFEELTYLPKPYMDYKFQGAAPAEASSKAIGGTGTGYGGSVYSPTYEVPFVRSTNKRMVVMYYDTVDTLREMGVPVDPDYPNPFPGPKYVPYPVTKW